MTEISLLVKIIKIFHGFLRRTVLMSLILSITYWVFSSAMNRNSLEEKLISFLKPKRVLKPTSLKTRKKRFI